MLKKIGFDPYPNDWSGMPIPEVDELYLRIDCLCLGRSRDIAFVVECDGNYCVEVIHYIGDRFFRYSAILESGKEYKAPLPGDGHFWSYLEMKSEKIFIKISGTNIRKFVMSELNSFITEIRGWLPKLEKMPLKNLLLLEYLTVKFDDGKNDDEVFGSPEEWPMPLRMIYKREKFQSDIKSGIVKRIAEGKKLPKVGDLVPVEVFLPDCEQDDKCSIAYYPVIHADPEKRFFAVKIM